METLSKKSVEDAFQLLQRARDVWSEKEYVCTEKEFEAVLRMASGYPKDTAVSKAFFGFNDLHTNLENAEKNHDLDKANLERIEASLAGIPDPNKDPKVVLEHAEAQKRYESSRLALERARKTYVEGYAGPNGLRAIVLDHKFAEQKKEAPPPITTPVPKSDVKKGIPPAPQVEQEIPPSEFHEVVREELTPQPARVRTAVPEKEPEPTPPVRERETIRVREKRRSSPWSWILGIAAILALIIAAAFFVTWYRMDSVTASRVQSDIQGSSIQAVEAAKEKAFQRGVIRGRDDEIGRRRSTKYREADKELQKLQE